MRRFLTIGLLAIAPAVSGQTIVLKNATLIDGTGSPARRGVSIVVTGDRISDIFTDTRALPKAGTTLDLTGKFVMPGLIDSHVHLATDPVTTDPRNVVERRLSQALYGGVTSVRDMAGDVRMLADLQRAAMAGQIESPSIYYSALWAGPAFFSDPRSIAMTRGLEPGKPPWALALTDSTNIPLAVAAARGSGATGIKIYALVDGPLVERVTAEARRQGMKVWAHARVRPASPKEVVAAGVESVSHSDMFICAIDACTQAPTPAVYERAALSSPAVTQLLQDMKRRGTILDATLFVYEVLGQAERQPAEQRARYRARGRFGAAFTAAAHKAGVELSAGTDSIGDGDPAKYPNVHEELRLLVSEAGLSPLAAIRAGTLGGAKAIGIERTHGTIEAGKIADLVVLEKDPLADIANTQSVRQVIHNGKLYSRDTVLTRRAVLFIEASDAQIDSLRNKYNEDDFATIADDMMWYRATAVEYLEKLKLPVTFVAGRKSFEFMVNGKPQRYDFADVETLDMIVLYEPNREPRVIATVDVQVAAEYFGIRQPD